MLLVLGVVAVLLPFSLPVINQIPFVRYLGDSDWLRVTTSAVIFAVAALGLNLLTGVAGQVSLGHAFFMGVGAYTAVFLGGEASGRTWGHGLPMWVWLPGAGIGAALVGVIVAPAAIRVRGLYLAIVTVGLVFVGIHLSRVVPEISGQSEVGRDFPALEWRWWKEEEAAISFTDDGHWLWFDISGEAKSYLFALALLVVAVVVAKNLVRTRTGRALQAIRDRDVAAEIMGVPEFRYKMIAFALSSFFAGVGGRVVRLVRRSPAAGVLEPRPVGRVHRHHPHRRRRDHVGRPARHVLRRPAAPEPRALRPVDERAGERLGTVG